MGTSIDSQLTSRYMMHSELLAQQSKPLEVLVNGDMTEASEGVVGCLEVDPGTLIRFCQFAYMGDYTGPELTAV